MLLLKPDLILDKTFFKINKKCILILDTLLKTLGIIKIALMEQSIIEKVYKIIEYNLQITA